MSKALKAEIGRLRELLENLLAHATREEDDFYFIESYNVPSEDIEAIRDYFEAK